MGEKWCVRWVQLCLSCGKQPDSFFMRLHFSTIYFTACFTLPVSHTGTRSDTTCVVIHSTNTVKPEWWGRRAKPSRGLWCLAGGLKLYLHVVLWLKMCLFVAVHFCFNKPAAHCEISERRTHHTSWCSCVSISAADRVTTRQTPLNASGTDIWP